MTAAVLTFEEETHTYRAGGRKIPSVTTVLYHMLYKEELECIPRDALEAARDFGVHVHLACDLFNAGQLDEESLSPALVPYLEGYKKFLAESGAKVIASEKRLFNPTYGYAGTVDIECDWRNKIWSIDLKSGYVPWTVGLQTAAYAEASDTRPKRRGCLRLLPNDYKFIECKDPADFQRFNAALVTFKFKNSHKELSNVSDFYE